MKARAVVTALTKADEPRKPSAQDYAALIALFRQRQLEVFGASLGAMASLFDEQMDAILRQIRSLPDGEARRGADWLNTQMNALLAIDRTLTTLTREYEDMIDSAMIRSTQTVADRQDEIETLIGAPPDERLSYVQDGTLALIAARRAQGRVYPDGMALAGRLDSLDRQTRKIVETILLAGLTKRTSASDMAGQLAAILAYSGPENPRYRALLIGGAEMRSAFREAAVEASLEPNGQPKDYIEAIAWRLSAAHPAEDICDIYASDDSGLGPGNYEPGDVPLSHVNCLCDCVPVVVGIDAPPVAKEPNPAAVPRSQASYYAQRGNGPASRWLDTYGANGTSE
jgi:hypothetical protein